MKKLLTGLLMCTALTMGACNTKVNEMTINDSDSQILKDYKTLYNLDVKSYNKNDLQDEVMKNWEREAKAHPKDDMGVILVRSSLNYIDFSSKNEGPFSGKELFQNILNNLLDQNKELKKCDESEFKKVKKIPEEKLEELRKIEIDAHAIRTKSSELTEFDKTYKEIGQDALKSLTKGNSESKGLTGEEFLKKNYKKLWKEARKKQQKALEDMKNKIENMK